MAETLLTFVVDQMWLGVTVARVEEVLRRHAMTPVPLAPPAVGGLLNLRGQIVLAVDLRNRLCLAPRAEDSSAMHVVVRSDDAVHSLLVDEIGEVLQLDQPSERVPERVPASVRELATGVYKLPGRLLLALDVDRVLDPMALGG